MLQQSESAIHVHISALFWIYFPIRSPQSTEESSLGCTVGSHELPMLHIVFPWWLSSKESACSAWATVDTGSIPGLGRSPEERHSNPLQYSCLENSPWTEESGELQSIGSQRVRHDWSDLTDRDIVSIVYICQSQSPNSSQPLSLLGVKSSFLNQSKEQNSSLASFFLSTYIVKVYTLTKN